MEAVFDQKLEVFEGLEGMVSSFKNRLNNLRKRITGYEDPWTDDEDLAKAMQFTEKLVQEFNWNAMGERVCEIGSGYVESLGDYFRRHEKFKEVTGNKVEDFIAYANAFNDNAFWIKQRAVDYEEIADLDVLGFGLPQIAMAMFGLPILVGLGTYLVTGSKVASVALGSLSQIANIAGLYFGEMKEVEDKPNYLNPFEFLFTAFGKGYVMIDSERRNAHKLTKQYVDIFLEKRKKLRQEYLPLLQ